MLQQARRIGDLSMRGGTGDFRDLATLQCHSYLAAINSLSLVPEDQAWVTIPVDDESRVRSIPPPFSQFPKLTKWRQNQKRTKINYHIPEEEYDDQTTRQVDVMNVDDIRREYTILLSRLLLIPEFPELARTSTSSPPFRSLVIPLPLLAFTLSI